MQEQRKKRSLFSIIFPIVLIVVLVVGMVIWRNWETKHREELRASVLSTESVAERTEPRAESTTPVVRRELPEDPEVLLTMAEEALRDEGYFEEDSARKRVSKGSHVCFLLGKALECSCDVQKAEALCQRLKERSAESNYGTWYVSGDLLTQLDAKIKEAKES